MGLINATGTKAPDIEFLERHHIGLASGRSPRRSAVGLLVRLRRHIGTRPTSAPKAFDPLAATATWVCL